MTELQAAEIIQLLEHQNELLQVLGVFNDSALVVFFYGIVAVPFCLVCWGLYRFFSRFCSIR